jgi:Rps23 Pro-64 3,4-dihydroxylase Tpa1-like proline 4-hydroxylase
VGDERAETYLWLLTETVLRQAGGQLRALDAARNGKEHGERTVTAGPVRG